MTVDDTIYRQAAIDVVKGIDIGFVKYIEELPSAQPEIIRCRDCQNYYFADNRIPQEQRHVCSVNGEKWNPDDYCSYAERRADEQVH